jgi:hypothetical protein
VNGVFTVPLRRLSAPGPYRVLLAVTLAGNAVGAPVKIVEHAVITR